MVGLRRFNWDEMLIEKLFEQYLRTSSYKNELHKLVNEERYSKTTLNLVSNTRFYSLTCLSFDTAKRLG